MSHSGVFIVICFPPFVDRLFTVWVKKFLAFFGGLIFVGVVVGLSLIGVFVGFIDKLFVVFVGGVVNGW